MLDVGCWMLAGWRSAELSDFGIGFGFPEECWAVKTARDVMNVMNCVGFCSVFLGLASIRLDKNMIRIPGLGEIPALFHSTHGNGRSSAGFGASASGAKVKIYE